MCACAPDYIARCISQSCALSLLRVFACVLLCAHTWEQTQELVLFKMEPPPEPWSPPSNLWLYWGATPNKRFGHSGDNVRHLVKLGRMAGGEYRDPHFMFDWSSQTFRDLSESCCTAMLMPPMKNNMPIFNANAGVAQVCVGGWRMCGPESVPASVLSWHESGASGGFGRCRDIIPGNSCDEMSSYCGETWP